MLYVVIGIYADNGQRYAGQFEADSADDAEAQALADVGNELQIAGTLRQDPDGLCLVQ